VVNCPPQHLVARASTDWFRASCFVLLVVGQLIVVRQTTAAEGVTPLEVAEVVVDSYRETHDGWSSDEVLLDDELNGRFIGACLSRFPEANEAEMNWKLLTLRKAGKLDVPTTQRRRDDLSSLLATAEITARHMEDKHAMNLDRVLCDPQLRHEFDVQAQQLAPDASAYLLRKAAFGLRKSRQLKPELVVRIANWDKEVRTATVRALRDDLSQIPTSPGVYLFRDRSGFLYIGEAGNLHKRLAQHIEKSDRRSLAAYLAEQAAEEISVEMHIFAPDSPAKKVSLRRAYESELIRSREPRFNVRP